MGIEFEEQIRLWRTPGDAKSKRRSTRVQLRADWEDVRGTVMYQAILKKFRVHCQLRERLLGTGMATLVENSRGDYYWGCGANGTGKNNLGETLVKVREELRTMAGSDQAWQSLVVDGCDNDC